MWSVRAYKEEDKDKLIEIYRREWGQSAAEKFASRWRWEFESSPNNPRQAPYVLILQYHNIVVGFLAGIAVNLSVGGRMHNMLWIVDYVTDPRHRGRGDKLVKKAIQAFTTIAGFPDNSLGNLLKRLGILNICSLPLFVRPLNMNYIVGTFVRNKYIIKIAGILLDGIFELVFKRNVCQGVKDVSITKAFSFDDRIDRFWSEIHSDYHCIVVRNKEYLNWRFVTCPVEHYTILFAKKKGEILGYIILRCATKNGTRIGYIVDTLAKLTQKGVAQCLISEAIEHFRTENVHKIVCYVKNKRIQRLLNANGFFRWRSSCRLAGYTNAPDISVKAFKNPENWFLTRGDSDLDLV
jgi:RimJ/RimL family protein N-acetyltransferase